MFKNPLKEPGAVQIEAHELAIRVRAGQKIRLVCLPYTFPKTWPDKVNGEWPLIVEAELSTDPGPTRVLIVTEHQVATDTGYGPRPDYEVIVVPG